MILEAEADLVPMGPRSPLRSGRRRADIPRMSCAPSSARLRLLWGRCLWFKVSPPARSARGMRSPGPHSPHLPHGFGCCVAGAHGSKVSALLRSAQSRHPRMFYGLRSVSVVAEQTSPGRLATHLLHGYGRGRAGAHGLRSRLCTPSSALKWGKLNYTNFVQKCI